eukprot:6862185-Pyramimonas_sp.AAC.1
MHTQRGGQDDPSMHTQRGAQDDPSMHTQRGAQVDSCTEGFRSIHAERGSGRFMHRGGQFDSCTEGFRLIHAQRESGEEAQITKVGLHPIGPSCEYTRAPCIRLVRLDNKPARPASDWSIPGWASQAAMEKSLTLSKSSSSKSLSGNTLAEANAPILVERQVAAVRLAERFAALEVRGDPL